MYALKEYIVEFQIGGLTIEGPSFLTTPIKLMNFSSPLFTVDFTENPEMGEINDEMRSLNNSIEMYKSGMKRS